MPDVVNKRAAGLIIFVRNPLLGQVKSRLAKTLGEEKALEIYKLLLHHTHAITKNLSVDKYVFYTGFICKNDLWENNIYQKQKQQGANLGERMTNAFSLLFQKEYSKIVIIGSDCLQLTSKIISDAFASLQKFQTVLGPSKDGGYYLLGMNNFFPEVFRNIIWSSEMVLHKTIQNITQSGLSHHLLAVLNDIDTIDDWNAYSNNKIK